MDLFPKEPEMPDAPDLKNLGKEESVARYAAFGKALEEYYANHAAWQAQVGG